MGWRRGEGPAERRRQESTILRPRPTIVIPPRLEVNWLPVEVDPREDGAIAAHVLNGAADALLVDGFASWNFEAALLHHASSVVPDAIAELTGLRGISRNLENELLTYFLFFQGFVSLLAFRPCRTLHRYHNPAWGWSVPSRPCRASPSGPRSGAAGASSNSTAPRELIKNHN